jgi:hypothetical protein
MANIGKRELRALENGVKIQTKIKRSYYHIAKSKTPLRVSKPMSDSEGLFLAAVTALWEGQLDAENTIIRLSESQLYTGGHAVLDIIYTEAFLDALRWGLRKYGIKYEGYDFYQAICNLERRFRNRYWLNIVSLALVCLLTASG